MLPGNVWIMLIISYGISLIGFCVNKSWLWEQQSSVQPYHWHAFSAWFIAKTITQEGGFCPMCSLISGQTVVFPSDCKRMDLVPGIFISVSNRKKWMSQTILFRHLSNGLKTNSQYLIECLGVFRDTLWSQHELLFPLQYFWVCYFGRKVVNATK